MVDILFFLSTNNIYIYIISIYDMITRAYYPYPYTNSIRVQF